MDPEAADLSQPRGRAWALPVAGALLLSAGFLRANPWFGSGRGLWPWELITESKDVLSAVNWAMWMLTGVLAIVWGLRSTLGWRAPVLGALGLVLLFTCYSGLAGLAVRSQSLPWMLGTVLMMAGFIRGDSQRGQTASRLAVGVGALMVLWAMGGAFRYAEGGVTRSQLHQLLRDMVSRVTEGTVEQFDLRRDDMLWASGALLLGCLAAFLHALGRSGRIVCGLGIVAVACFYMIPTFSALGRSLSAPGGSSSLPTHISELLIEAGFGVAWLATAACAALMAQGESER